MPIQTHFSGIYKPVQVSSDKPFEGKTPVALPQRAMPTRNNLAKMAGVDNATLRGDFHDRKGNLIFLTDEDIDGLTDAQRARPEIQENVNELDAAMKAKGLTQIPFWGPVGEIQQRIDALKRDVFEAYLQTHKERIESIPYYIKPTPIQRLVKVLKNWQNPN